MRKLTTTLHTKVASPQYAEHMIRIGMGSGEDEDNIKREQHILTFTSLHKSKLKCPVCIIHFLEELEFYICM